MTTSQSMLPEAERVAPPSFWGPGQSVAVVIPCRNEERSIGKVVEDFRRALPQALIVVVDNASTDATALRASEAGATVLHESRRGKGFAVVRGFRAARDADFVVLVDGDDTYPADAVHDLLDGLRAGADMTIGTRLTSFDDGAYRPGHTLGNRLFILLVRVLFGVQTQDLFSGYRAFTQRFLTLSPLIARGFELEAELSMQALAGSFVVTEVPVHYRARGEGSVSKLSTMHDGYRILIALLAFFRDYRPLSRFVGLAVVLFLLSALTPYIRS
jgi:glycosyltransferase involved in cell wall biosynthesis